MLKKIYIKNGIIMIPIIDNMQLNYNIINDKNILDKNVLDTAKKKYNATKGCVYNNK
tara:strand:+ start:498 stop:668 length:171 start_codon:yes stop_codon:yes gene_type:complete